MNISLTKKEIEVLQIALDSYEDVLVQSHSPQFKSIKNSIDSLDAKLHEAAKKLDVSHEEGQN